MLQLSTEHSSLSDDPADQEATMAPIFDTIIEHIPAQQRNPQMEPLQFQGHFWTINDFCWAYRYRPCFPVGTVKVGDQVTLSKLDGTTKNFRVTKLRFRSERREIQEAKAGDLIAASGMEDIWAGETITRLRCWSSSNPTSMSQLFKWLFWSTTSPFASKEGKWVTSRKRGRTLAASGELVNRCFSCWPPTDSARTNGLFQVVENCTVNSGLKPGREGYESCLVQRLS